MATIDLAKLQANLMTDSQTGDKQVLESTIMAALPIMMGEMPSSAYTNKTGSEDAAGNVTFYKVPIMESNIKDFDKIGDISRFKDINTTKVLVAVDTIIENPVRYNSAELAKTANGILNIVEQGISANMAERRELDILEMELTTATTKGNVTSFDMDAMTTDELEATIDKTIAKLRNQKDAGIRKVKKDRLIIKLSTEAYQKLLKVRLIANRGISNDSAFNKGEFPADYKGVKVIEAPYLTDVDESFVGSISMIGAIAAPWQPEGVFNGQAQGEANTFLLNPQIRYKIAPIYEDHIYALVSTSDDGETDPVEPTGTCSDDQYTTQASCELNGGTWTETKSTSYNTMKTATKPVNKTVKKPVRAKKTV